MEQLIKIETVPINYELKVSNAKLERQNGMAELEISKNSGGGLKIKSRPIQLRLDTFEARNSISPSTARSIQQAAQEGKSAAYAASAQYAGEGRLMLQTQIGEGRQTIDQVLAQRTARPTGDFGLGFTPATGPEIDWTPPALSIEYEMDKLTFDLKVDQGQVEFIPGDIELVINQHPELNIEYVGGPIYVPPSAEQMMTGQNVDVQA